MTDKAKIWIGGASLALTIILSLVGYVYAEATGSRKRDTTEISVRASEDTDIRSQMFCYQKEQMKVLNTISVAVGKIQTDVEYLKK